MMDSCLFGPSACGIVDVCCQCGSVRSFRSRSIHKQILTRRLMEMLSLPVSGRYCWTATSCARRQQRVNKYLKTNPTDRLYAPSVSYSVFEMERDGTSPTFLRPAVWFFRMSMQRTSYQEQNEPAVVVMIRTSENWSRRGENQSRKTFQRKEAVLDISDS